MKNSDTLLVGFDHSHDDIAVLIIGRKDAGEAVQIINQFQGKEAEELYQKLVTKKHTGYAPKVTIADEIDTSKR